MVQRSLLLVSSTVAVAAFWGMIVAMVADVGFLHLGFIAGMFVGACVSPVAVIKLRSNEAHLAVPLLLGGASGAVIITLPFGSILFALVTAVAAYVALCMTLPRGLIDELPAGPDRRFCPECNYPRQGLPTTTCPECGHTPAESHSRTVP